MSIQSQLDQVLALLERLQAFVAVRERMKGTDPEIITESDGVPLTMSDLRAAISAIRAAVGGEAKKVAWISKENLAVLDDYAAEKHQAWVEVTNDPGAAEITLYASPPATVDVGALRELEKTIRDTGETRYKSHNMQAAWDAGIFADKLAALIAEAANAPSAGSIGKGA